MQLAAPATLAITAGKTATAHPAKPVGVSASPPMCGTNPRCSVTLIGLKQIIATSELRQFCAEVKAGTHNLLISAEGHISQKKRVIRHDGEVIILNLDMARRHGSGRQRADRGDVWRLPMSRMFPGKRAFGKRVHWWGCWEASPSSHASQDGATTPTNPQDGDRRVLRFSTRHMSFL